MLGKTRADAHITGLLSDLSLSLLLYNGNRSTNEKDNNIQVIGNGQHYNRSKTETNRRNEIETTAETLTTKTDRTTATIATIEELPQGQQQQTT